MMTQHKGALSDCELLAIILRTGCHGKSAVELAGVILKKFGSLQNLQKASIQELVQLKGIGESKACQIVASLELGWRSRAMNDIKDVAFRRPSDIFEHLKGMITNPEQEHFIVFLLNTKNKVISHFVTSIGTVNATMVHPREVFKRAIKEAAHCIVVAHNHPSGDTQPSREDIVITKNLVEVGEMIGISLIEHIIFTDSDYYSFRKHNQI